MKSATCTVPLGLCSASGDYDGTAGNPAGSFAEKTSVLVNLGGLFNASVSTESPEFKVGNGGAGTLNLQREFTPGGLITLTPLMKYTATVLDKTAGTETQAISESVTAESGFASKGGAVTLIAGHSYAIRLDTEVSSSIAGIGLLGESVVRFDNVKLTDSAGNGGENGNNGGNGSDGGNGSNGLTDARLASLMQSSLVSPAVLKGKRITVKAKCPKKVGAACRISLQGLLKKGKLATTKSTAKVASGKSKRITIKIKPKLKAQVSAKKRLLFKESVKAGKAKATVYKSLKLVKRG